VVKGGLGDAGVVLEIRGSSGIKEKPKNNHLKTQHGKNSVKYSG